MITDDIYARTIGNTPRNEGMLRGITSGSHTQTLDTRHIIVEKDFIREYFLLSNIADALAEHATDILIRRNESGTYYLRAIIPAKSSTETTVQDVISV